MTKKELIAALADLADEQEIHMEMPVPIGKKYRRTSPIGEVVTHTLSPWDERKAVYLALPDFLRHSTEG